MPWELDEIELGVRADYWMTREQLALVYACEQDRVRSMTLYLLMSASLAGKAQ